MGLVPKTTKTESKAVFGLTMKRMIGLVMTMMLSYFVGQALVYRALLVPFIISCMVIYLVLGISAPNNPKKTLMQGLGAWMKDSTRPKRYLSIIGYAAKNIEEGGVVVVKESENDQDSGET